MGMRAFELYESAYIEAKRKGILNDPDVIQFLKEEKNFAEEFYPFLEDYRDPDLDKWIKNYKSGLEQDPKPGSFFVKVVQYPEAFGNIIHARKGIIQNPKDPELNQKNKLGQLKDMGVLYFANEKAANNFLMLLKSRYNGYGYEVVIRDGNI